MWNSTIGVLVFKDGVYAMKTKEFFTWGNARAESVISLVSTGRDFPKERPPPELAEELENRFWLPVFGGEQA